jgi:hypothetical protein
MEVTAVDQDFCPECQDERQFEKPWCLDGHGAECPELVCTVCGFASLTGIFPIDERPKRLRHVA